MRRHGNGDSASVQVRRHAELAEPELPVVRLHHGHRLHEVDEVRVRGLQILDDGAKLATFDVGQDAADLDVEGVEREAIRRTEDPVDAELRLAEHKGIGGEGRDGRDLDAQEEPYGVLDPLGRLPQKHVFAVPLKLRIGRTHPNALRKRQTLAMKPVVRPPILELILETPTDNQSLLAVDSDVASIEQAMNVGTKSQPVADGVLAAAGERPDVGGLEHGKRVLSGDRTGSAVRIENLDPEDPLAETGDLDRGGAVACCWLCNRE
jgi:hypothetical protein